MVLQSIAAPPYSLPSSISYSLSLPSGSRSVISIRTISAPIYRITCSVSRVDSQETLYYERRTTLKWKNIYKRISFMENPEMGAATVLDECENEGKKPTKWELRRVVRELRKFKKYKPALEVYEWMNTRTDRFTLFGSDAAIQLDLIAKLHGISSAEDYFFRMPGALKDKRIYGALLNAYVGAKMREKGESLMQEMRHKGYAMHPLPYNVMMTLYMKLKDYDNVDLLISEMKQKGIPLDIYSYNIWLSARGFHGSVEGMEEVFEEMKLNTSINPSWTTFSTMASMYIRLGQLGKAEECLKRLETRIMGQDRMPYHYLISLYGSVGNKEEVFRIWSIYKSVFPSIINGGYHAMISSLVRIGEIEGAETIYEEWMSVKSTYDPKIANLLMGWFVKEGKFEKAKSLFNHIAEAGAKPNSATWEILAEGHIRERGMSEAVSCFKEAASAPGSKNWMPKPVNVSAMLELCEREGDRLSKESLIELLRNFGCFQDETYRSVLSGFDSGMLFGDVTEESTTSRYKFDIDDANDQTENEESEMQWSIAE
ncbi:hypothetical protein Ancab_037247 [Ancistrocladus abbreviatus]